jgi:hypothetical protein
VKSSEKGENNLAAQSEKDTFKNHEDQLFRRQKPMKSSKDLQKLRTGSQKEGKTEIELARENSANRQDRTTEIAASGRRVLSKNSKAKARERFILPKESVR